MDLEEFRRILQEHKREIERLTAEADKALITKNLADTSLEEMRAYNNRVRRQIELREQFWKPPWWKRLFTKYPEFIA